jgi:hypothetical protein
MTKIEYGDGQVIEDIEAYVAAHEKLKTDVVGLRATNKELEQAVDSTSEDTVAKYKARAVRAEAKARLEADGVKDADRILKRISLENVDFDDDDNITGLDDSLTEFKTDFPELFDKKLRAAGKADSNANGVVEKQMTPSEMQAQALLS